VKATIEQAREDIKNGDYEFVFIPPTRNNKNRNCVFCGKNIKKGEKFYKHFEYPYLPNQARWVACVSCFKKEKERGKDGCL